MFFLRCHRLFGDGNETIIDEPLEGFLKTIDMYIHLDDSTHQSFRHETGELRIEMSEGRSPGALFQMLRGKNRSICEELNPPTTFFEFDEDGLF